MLKRQIEADVAIEFAIRGIARITFLRAPNLSARIAVARKCSGTRRREARRVNRATRLRISKEQSVRVENEPADICFLRSEEHTSELQSPCNLVCRLLLEK